MRESVPDGELEPEEPRGCFSPGRGRRAEMKVHDNGTIRDGSRYIGEITDKGYVYDDKKHYLGKIDENGELYGSDGQYLGKFDKESGRIYDTDGRIAGEIDQRGHITDRSGHSASEIPLFGNQPPPRDWTDDLDPLVKFFLLLFLAIGFLTVAIYCWVQLLISAVVSVLVGRIICKKAFSKGKEPFGVFAVAFAIIYIPTLVITLCQDWGDLAFERFLCIAGGILVGLALSGIVSRATVAACRKAYLKK